MGQQGRVWSGPMWAPSGFIKLGHDQFIVTKWLLIMHLKKEHNLIMENTKLEHPSTHEEGPC